MVKLEGLGLEILLGKLKDRNSISLISRQLSPNLNCCILQYKWGMEIGLELGMAMHIAKPQALFPRTADICTQCMKAIRSNFGPRLIAERSFISPSD